MDAKLETPIYITLRKMNGLRTDFGMCWWKIQHEVSSAATNLDTILDQRNSHTTKLYL